MINATMRKIDMLWLCSLVAANLMLLPAAGSEIRVIAHRGDSAHFPENTRSAFRSAMEKGADLVELDSHATKDGRLVVLHDSTLDRTTSAKEVFGVTGVAVAAKEWAQIKDLEAGSWKDPKFKGERLPTLEDSLKTIQAGSKTLLERKSGSALEHVKLLERLGYTESLVVQSFDWDFLAAVKYWNPKIRMAALCGEDVTPERVQDLVRLGVPIAAWKHDKLNQASVRLLREKGFEIWTWTVDEPKDWRRLVDLGVNGIITNKPGELQEWLKTEGLR